MDSLAFAKAGKQEFVSSRGPPSLHCISPRFNFLTDSDSTLSSDYHLQFSRNNINACFKISRRGGKGYASAALKKADKSKFEPEDNVPLKVSTLSPTFPCVFGQGNLLPQHRGFSVAIGGPHQPSKTTLPVTSQERNFMREDAEVLRSFYKHMRQVSGSSSSSKGSSKNLHIASPSSAAPSILPPLSNPEFDCSTSGSRRRQDQATSHGATLDGSSDRVSDDANFSGTGQQEMLICEPRAIEDMLSG